MHAWSKKLKKHFVGEITKTTNETNAMVINNDESLQ